jgi:PTS system N-acetylglucosamine-specific IIC component
VMMFGLPAACLAMYHAARKEQKKAVGGLLLSMGLTSFLTGITEPIEFTFMFLAPALYALHAVLTGVSMAVMDFLQVRHGFGFSAGLFDFVLNYGLSTRGWIILPFGAAYFVAYYLVFRWFIVRFNVPTPGRAEAEEQRPAAVGSVGPAGEAAALVAALGGRDNLLDIDACTTRLRLRVSSQDKVDEAALRSLGASGVLRPTKDTVQVIIGLRADEIAGNMRRAGSDPVDRVLSALGGRDNVREVECLGTRLSLQVSDASKVQEGMLSGDGIRALVKVGEDRFHLVTDSDALNLADGLRGRIV